MKRTSKRVMAVAVSLAMVLTGSTSALAATTNPEISDREIEHKTAAKNIAAQGMVLLENENTPLPISKEKGARSHFLVRAYTIPSKEVPVPVQ